MKKVKKPYNRRTKKAGAENGQSMVELALVIPLLLTLLCGILDFGWIYMNQYKVENAAYAGARYGAMYASQLSDSELKAGIRERVLDNLSDSADESLVEVEVSNNSSTISVSVNYKIKNLTYVAGTLFGAYYNADSTSASPIV